MSSAGTSLTRRTKRLPKVLPIVQTEGSAGTRLVEVGLSIGVLVLAVRSGTSLNRGAPSAGYEVLSVGGHVGLEPGAIPKAFPVEEVIFDESMQGVAQAAASPRRVLPLARQCIAGPTCFV